MKSVNLAAPNMGGLVPLSYISEDTPGILSAGKDDTVTFRSAVAPLQQAGHTGYLTFATLCHKDNMGSFEKETAAAE